MNQSKELFDKEWQDAEYYDIIKPGTFDEIMCWVYIDVFKSYKRFGHDVVVYISNDYSSANSSEYFVVSVSDNPIILVEPDVWNIHRIDVANVLRFVAHNYKKLLEIADDSVSGDVIDYLKNPIVENIQSFRMHNLPPDATGLPHKIWIDPGSGRKHPNRIKIFVNNETISLYLDSLKFEGNQKLLTGKEKEIYRRYVLKNREFINRFYKNNSYDFESLKTDLYKFDKSGNPIETDKFSFDYIVVKDYNYGLKLCKFSDGSLNIINKDDEILFFDEKDEPMKFQMINPFIKNNTGIVQSAAYDYNGNIYILRADGTYDFQKF